MDDRTAVSRCINEFAADDTTDVLSHSEQTLNRRKHRKTLFLSMVFSFASAGLAQSPSSAPSVMAIGPTSQSSHQMQMNSQKAPSMATIADAIDLQVTRLEKQVLDLAEAMPDDKFDFNPTNLNLKDSRDPVRTFAGQLKHLATDNYDMWSPLTGDAIPANIKDVNGPAELKTKAEVLQFVRGSFVIGHKAAATLTSQNAVELLPFRGMKMSRLYLATWAIEHANDHCGQLAIYLRLAGITPPGSRK
jgi:uncharacterized damage-inducible protein DinB